MKEMYLFPVSFLFRGGTNVMSFYRKLYRSLETFSCGILMLLSSLSLPRNLPEFFRDLLILTKFCQTRSIGSPDAFFQFPLKCFQQRLPFLRRKKHFASEGKMGKKREKKITTLESTESPRTIPV